MQRRLQNATTPAPRGTVEPTVQATLTVPRLDLRLPAVPMPAGSLPPPPALPVQLRGGRAELSGSLAQATLALQGEAIRGTHFMGVAIEEAAGAPGYLVAVDGGQVALEV